MGGGKPGEPQAGPLRSPPLPSSSLGFGCPWRASPFYRPVEPVGASLLTGSGKLGGGLALSSALDSGENAELLVPGEEGEKETASFLVKKGTFFFFLMLSGRTPLTLGVQKSKAEWGWG